MHFDLGDMTEGEMEGEIHIEIMGDMDDVPHAVREMVMQQMHRRGQGMPEMFMHMDEHDMHMDDHMRHEMFMHMEEEEMLGIDNDKRIVNNRETISEEKVYGQSHREGK